MSLSLNPVDVIKLLRENRNRDGEKLSHYLDALVRESVELLAVWDRNHEEAKKLLGDFCSEPRIEKVEVAWRETGNGVFAAALNSHYRSASATIRGRLPDSVKDGLINNLERILAVRTQVVERHELLQIAIASKGITAPTNAYDIRVAALLKFDNAVQRLRAETGELRALVEQFKAT